MVNHLAIIMDGNGRWAESKKLPRSVGHKKGAEAAAGIIKACPGHNIDFLTLYTFSSENWSRPEQEVSDLMNLLRFYLDKELNSFHKNGVKIRIIGDRTKLPKDIQKKVDYAEKLTAENTNLNLNVALSYGGRQEIVNAAKEIGRSIEKGQLEAEGITQEILSNKLYTKNIPDPDLLIRTGGDRRISNFLLWQMAYTEFYFTDILWPDFKVENLEESIQDFARRERRFGLTKHKEAV